MPFSAGAILLLSCHPLRQKALSRKWSRRRPNSIRQRCIWREFPNFSSLSHNARPASRLHPAHLHPVCCVAEYLGSSMSHCLSLPLFSSTTATDYLNPAVANNVEQRPPLRQRWPKHSYYIQDPRRSCLSRHPNQRQLPFSSHGWARSDLEWVHRFLAVPLAKRTDQLHSGFLG